MNGFIVASFDELRETITYVKVEIGYAFADAGGLTIEAELSFPNCAVARLRRSSWSTA